MEVSDVTGLVKNSDKDSIVLTVHREGVKEAMELTVSITDVELPYVFHEMLEDQIGYIRITEFAGVTAEQYRKAFADLDSQDFIDFLAGFYGRDCRMIHSFIWHLKPVQQFVDCHFSRQTPFCIFRPS